MRLPVVRALISFISEMAITMGKQFEQGSVTITHATSGNVMTVVMDKS